MGGKSIAPSSTTRRIRKRWVFLSRTGRSSHDRRTKSTPQAASLHGRGDAVTIRTAFLIAVLLTTLVRADEPPVIPVGLDAYRMWDRWAQQRIGARAYMRSTYDRTGGNRGPDASHFLHQLADDHNVTLDLQGAGILYFA